MGQAPTYQVHVGEVSPGLAVEFLRGGCHLGQDFPGVLPNHSRLHHLSTLRCILRLLIGLQRGVEGEGPRGQVLERDLHPREGKAKVQH